MANPQPDHFTRISNELLEALARVRIPGEARQIFDVILRKTYGYNRTFSHIGNSEFCDATGLKKQMVHRSLKKLEVMGIIVINNDYRVIKKDYQRRPKIRINKDYDTWKLPEKVTRGGNQKRLLQSSKKITAVIKNDNSTPPQAAHSAGSRDPKDSTKDNIKTNPLKSGAKSIAPAPTPGQITRLFFDMHQGQIERTDFYQDYAAKLPVDELDNFVMHWTEPTKSGKRELWETKPSFELSRRMMTWRRNMDKFSRNGKSGDEKYTPEELAYFRKQGLIE